MAFAFRYGSSGINVAGQYTGKLSNAGETLTMNGSFGLTIESFAYDDGGLWPTEPDGDGPSLRRVNFAVGPGNAGAWEAGPDGGTPGSF